MKINFKKIINWKLYFILLLASIFAIIAVLPYVLTLQADSLTNLPLPFPLAILLSALQSSFLFAIVIFIGLKLSKKIGLGLPFIEGFITKKDINLKIRNILKISIIIGILVGTIIFLLDLLFIKIGVDLGETVSVPIWQGFLASFYGGIGEEILLRLFFMTLIIWIFSKIKKSGEIIQNNLVICLSIILSALLFGIGHLPATSILTTLTPLVIFRCLLLNGIGGIAFGWLYWKKGLESAMIAHFSADIMLHVVLTLI